jgi:hypothetical protein
MLLPTRVDSIRAHGSTSMSVHCLLLHPAFAGRRESGKQPGVRCFCFAWFRKKTGGLIGVQLGMEGFW